MTTYISLVQYSEQCKLLHITDVVKVHVSPSKAGQEMDQTSPGQLGDRKSGSPAPH